MTYIEIGITVAFLAIIPVFAYAVCRMSRHEDRSLLSASPAAGSATCPPPVLTQAVSADGAKSCDWREDA